MVVHLKVTRCFLGGIDSRRGHMLELLDRKIRQMHEALGGLEESDLSSITPERVTTPHIYYCQIDFSQGTTDVGLANIISLLIANIACMKDHLKVWCAKNGKSFDGENLINTNIDVAIVHDLWNIDKHADLNRPPRSGHRPKVQNLRQSLKLSTGTSAGSAAVFTIDPRTGKVKTETKVGGSVSLAINGDVVDEYGVLLGDFAGICERATTAWEQTLRRAGVPIPGR
jgi:hypothetical protein